MHKFWGKHGDLGNSQGFESIIYLAFQGYGRYLPREIVVLLNKGKTMFLKLSLLDIREEICVKKAFSAPAAIERFNTGLAEGQHENRCLKTMFNWWGYTGE